MAAWACRKLPKPLERRVWNPRRLRSPVTHVLGAELKAAGVAAQKVEVICNGIDPAKFSRDKNAAARRQNTART